ncbi:MAG TPA: helix-turn-helix domain-containing protein [Aldersonia sp.]
MSEVVTTQRRPRNRKQLIVAAAARQFQRRGFHDASIADIAADVGITGPALYRHFRGKQELLAAAVELEIEQVAAAYADAPSGLREMLEHAAGRMQGSDHVGAVWERNQAHLAPQARMESGERYRRAVAPLRHAIERARPDLDRSGVDLVLWASQSALSGDRAFGAGKVSRERALALIVEAAWSVCEIRDFGSVSLSESGVGGVAGRIMPASRREAILQAAVALFAERGFQAVGMDDIGKAAGITGPTLYHHFPGKSALLVAAVTRCMDALQFDVSSALAGTDDPVRALESVLASFVRVNVAYGDALSAVNREIVNIPADERAPIRRLQAEYVGEWVALLMRVRPDLSAAEAHGLVRTGQSVVNRLRGRLRGEPEDVRTQLGLLGGAILGLSGSTRPEAPSSGREIRAPDTPPSLPQR